MRRSGSGLTWGRVVWGLALLGLAGRSDVGATSPACPGGPVPAATLLIPYFEVDLAAAEGATTLVAVHNADDEATLAHVVLWTDWGVPTLAFDLFLAGHDVQSMNLRDLFSGVLPVTGGGGLGSDTGCTQPLTLPALGAAALETLRRQHTGLSYGGNNRCAGSGRAGVDVATGYVTVDVVRSCSATILYPSSGGYFEPGGTGIATNDNRLLGDFFLVDAAQNLAEGSEAVHILADEVRFGGRTETFYGAWTGHSGDDARTPLGTHYRARFLNGGAFSGGTELVVWAEPNLVVPLGVPCGERLESVDLCQYLNYSFFDEAGGTELDQPWSLVTEVTAKVAVGGPDLPTGYTFGFVDVENRIVPGCDIPIGGPPLQTYPLQSFVGALHGASGRFAVGVNAARVREDLCLESWR